MPLAIFAIVLIAAAIIGGFVLYRHYHPPAPPAAGAATPTWGQRISDWMASAFAWISGAIGGLIGLLLTLAFAVGVALLIWASWGWIHDEVYLRFFDEQAYECLSPDNREEAIECVRLEAEETQNKSDVEYVLDNPELFLTPEADPDPKS